jgi:hypothetical protein
MIFLENICIITNDISTKLTDFVNSELFLEPATMGRKI